MIINNLTRNVILADVFPRSVYYILSIALLKKVR
jgi:hypothetical protein